MIKKVVILDHDGGELANQLWNYASIYAYTLERGVKLFNPSFYEYASWFPKHQSSKLFEFFFVRPFRTHIGRKNSLKRRFWRKIYLLYPWIIAHTKKDSMVTRSVGEPYYLPPTKSPSTILEKDTSSTIYFNGWLFRNPEGLKKYRNEIISFFTPRDTVMRKITKEIADARKRYSHIVGVHIRQGDYRTWQNGKYFIDAKRTKAILDEYLKAIGLPIATTLFIITSDGAIDLAVFAGLNIKRAQGNAIEDLFLLSKTDAIIGSDSTYGDFAAYYGDIPHIVMTKSPIDWEYYKNIKKYVMGKYMTWVHF